jgi:D-glycero-D-manno-heptose 1,7-bisphosphate phosphatase
VKLLILDRDGVINEDSDDYIKNADEWLPLPDSIEAIASLSRAGFTIYVATNQSGLGRGLFGQSELDAMHTKLKDLVAKQGGSLEGIFYCPHRPDENCNCRKPKPGLLQQIAADARCSLQNVPLIGDSLRDLEAGLAMGCLPILVKTGKGSKTLSSLKSDNSPLLQQLSIFESLAEAADYLIKQQSLTAGEHTQR